MMENFIKEVCNEYGLTMKELAEEFWIPLRTVQNWAYRGTCPLYVRMMIIDVLEYRLFKTLANKNMNENKLSCYEFFELEKEVELRKSEYAEIVIEKG